jgi:monofunctional chorismate mutase
MTLEEARQDIDKIDNELRELFLKRMKVSEAIAEIKAASGDEIYKPDREKIVIDRLTAGVDEDVKDEYTQFVKKIMEISRNYQFKKISEKN